MVRVPSLALLCAAAIAPAGAAQVQAYLIDSNLDVLYSVDIATGAATQIASTANNALDTPADLAWRSDTNELWTIDLAGGEVGTIDVTNGTFTPVFQTSLSGWQGMAWDPATQKYYLANQSGTTYVLDPVTGITTLLGPTGYSLITCLDLDPAGDIYGIDFFNRNVVRIDRTTGAGTLISQTLAGFQGLGIDAATGIWYGANTNDDALHRIDPATGAATLIGLHGAGVQFAKGFDLVDNIGVRVRGTGCTDSTGAVFRLQSQGIPRLGQIFSIQGVYGAAAPFWLIGGVSDQNWLGIALPLDLTPFGGNGCSLYTSEELVVGPFGQGGGISAPIPNLPLFVGSRSFWQGFQIDGAIPRSLPIATSNFLEVTIQR